MDAALHGEAFDVPDSTDWLDTPLKGLMPVEQAFRCHVCKDFYNSPMLTSCNHTFCSICIRRCLMSDGKCPLCRAADQESKLRGNWAMREAVDAFVQSRDVILKFARTQPTAEAAVPRSPKRKAAESDGTEYGGQENKRPRISTRSSAARGEQATAAIMRDEWEVPEDHDFGGNFEPDDGLVSCPICLLRMKPFKVDKHLDTSCPGSPQPQPQRQQQPQSSTSQSWSNPAFRPARSILRSPPTQGGKAPERLPGVVYSMLKDTALRKKMSDLGLSTSGTRQMLERRHQEWITIWNANCDLARPKRRSDLLHDLDIWEKTMGSRAPTSSRAAAVGAQIKDKDFDGAAWASKHNDSFKDLIANARRTKSKAEKKGQEQESTTRPAPNNTTTITNPATNQLTRPIIPTTTTYENYYDHDYYHSGEQSNQAAATTNSAPQSSNNSSNSSLPYMDPRLFKPDPYLSRGGGLDPPSRNPEDSPVNFPHPPPPVADGTTTDGRRQQPRRNGNRPSEPSPPPW
ncbi:hypothetical protein B0H63DRAFT_132255 [Podospora didyma]|uniref:Postreplication repair E3 ubiquitin-protein ligase RAD18 n=1 Tax=Podospora didyma TaxID=330526 RepID=A0AAE0U4V1_9PEZI|nr:hypothetical protein B0H63DRAFT_132255 [Podospora didyma]